MTKFFTPEIGQYMLGLFYKKNWNICYEWRNRGNPDAHQSIEEIYGQVATTLINGPRYYVFPAPLNYEQFELESVSGDLQVPVVTIEGERRILIGMGIREDHCHFVTNSHRNIATADREPKDYDFVLAALETLEEFTIDHPSAEGVKADSPSI
jgi:hypothetical protein